VETFAARAESMGLDISQAEKGMFSYRDMYSEVVYRQLCTAPHQGENEEGNHPTDGIEVPYLGIFIRAPQEEQFSYSGYISKMYKFVGNAALTDPIRESIVTTGNPILRENNILSGDYARFRHEMIISSSVKSAIAGDIMPAIIVNNSYNGTKAASISFGISTMGRSGYLTFAFRLGEIRMIHIESSDVSMTTAVSDYVQTFQGNISSMISESMSKRLTEEEMLATLDLVEGLGKRRRDIISGNLPETVTAWGMFMAIVRYSSFEANLNVKSMLENIAESVLVIPGRMYEVLDRLNQ
jgi:hypothetical protein